MNRRFYFILSGILICTALAISFKPLIVFAIKANIKNTLKADTVQIADFQFNSFNEICLKGLFIEKKRDFKVRVQDLCVGFRLMDILKGDIESVKIQQASGEYQKVHVEDFNFYAAQNSDGKLSIAKISYDKGHVTDLQGLVQMKGHQLEVSDFAADFLEGQILANINITIAPELSYRAGANFKNMNIERFIDDFELRKKIEMTGIVNGALEVAGQGADFTVLSGNFKIASPSGLLIIKDRKLLENIVQRAFLDTAIESLQDYHYNAGVMQVSLDEHNIVVDVNLNGRQGKRDFKIVYHP